MLTCPLCQTELPVPAPRCPRCQTDLSLLADFVTDLKTLLDKADSYRKAGDLAAAVQEYLAVLDVDPTNMAARTALGPAVLAVRAAGGGPPPGPVRPTGLTLLLTMGLAVSAFAIGYTFGQRRQPTGGGTMSTATQNSILVIAPYKWNGLWVFDDPRVGLDKEPFVAGVPEIIEAVVKDIPDAEDGFVLLFSAGPFPGADVELEWVREDGGNWYRWIKTGQEGWLCPALFKYFDKAPPKLYAQAKPKT